MAFCKSTDLPTPVAVEPYLVGAQEQVDEGICIFVASDERLLDFFKNRRILEPRRVIAHDQEAVDAKNRTYEHDSE